MNLEVRICKEKAEVHLIDPSCGRPLSIIKSDLKALNSLLIDLRTQYSVKSIKRKRKPLLTN
jgi:hypothetical protein